VEADALNQAAAWDKAGVGLHLIDMGGQSVNTRSAMGRMFFTMAAGFAELERGLIAERTSSAMKIKRDRLEVYSRPTVGFDAIDGRLIANDAEQALITRISSMRSTGLSFAKIADQLNAEGVATKRGGRWFASTIKQIIDRAA
jgi:site-specific DNA recombinase